MNGNTDMHEDEKFLGFLKTQLEADVSVSPKSRAIIQALAHAEAQKRQLALFRRRRLYTSLAAAAGLTLMCGIGLFLLQPISNADQQIVQAIELLDDAELLDQEQVEGMDTADLLLAWQDAPYTNLEEELALGNL